MPITPVYPNPEIPDDPRALRAPELDLWDPNVKEVGPPQQH
jgi:hypothetical protein